MCTEMNNCVNLVFKKLFLQIEVKKSSEIGAFWSRVGIS